MPLSAASREFVQRLEQLFTANAHQRKAAEMRSYMRDQFTYLGLPSPTRRALHAEAQAGYTTDSEVFDLAVDLYGYEHREYQYVACDLMRSFMRRKRRPDFDRAQAFATTERLIRTKPWWDTVDILAPAVAYPLIMESDELDLRETARRWIEDDDFWVQRSAIILQLGGKANTDADLMFELILRRADSTEFFIRKGSGWALRQHSKIDPELIRAFIDTHQERLSPLTKREGGKYC